MVLKLPATSPLSRVRGLTRSAALVEWERAFLEKRKESIATLEERQKAQAQLAASMRDKVITSN